MGEGKLVRVKPEIEELIREVSEKLGYAEYTIRNLSILYGLPLVYGLRNIPKTDEEFQKLIRNVRGLILK